VPPVFQILSRGGQEVADVDGAVGPFGSVEGTYLHGVFGNPVVRRALLRYLARRRTLSSDPRWGAMASDPYERLADLVGPSLDMPAVARLVGLALPHPRVVQG
jgi:adenosylcobyric acid synthase